MKYYFKVGRGKKVIIDEDATFADLGFKILDEYRIDPDHLFMFIFSNGEFTNSGSPLGPIDDDPDGIPIDMKIKDRNMDTDETMTFIYDYSTNWSRKVRLIRIYE